MNEHTTEISQEEKDKVAADWRRRQKGIWQLVEGLSVQDATMLLDGIKQCLQSYSIVKAPS